jgi:hypothetical protein
MRAAAIIVALLLAAAAVRAAEQQDLAARQSQARERMQEVEQRLLELADTLQPQDPVRAEALRRALTLSRQQFVVSNMGQAEGQLQSGNYGAAEQSEQQVLAALGQLSAILAEPTAGPSPGALLAAQKRLSDLAKRQGDLAERTSQSPQSADALSALAPDQQAIAADLKALLDSLNGAPPSEDLNAALGLMSDAQTALSAGRKADAVSAQAAAQQRLQAAGRRLQEAIDAGRQAEQAQARAGLVAALQRMLDEQRAVTAQTADLQREAAAGPTGRTYRLRALALAAREAALQKAAGDVLAAVTKDATTLALPAALKQTSADLAECARLLGQAQAGPRVAGLQQAVEAALAALIDALNAAQQAQAQQSQTPPEQQAEGQKPPLVGEEGQLRVLRAMQLCLNAQTQALAPDSKEQAAGLAARQGELADVARGLKADGPAGDMETAQGQLAKGEAGEPVQSAQRDAVSKLDGLIAAAEEQARKLQQKQSLQPGSQGGSQTPKQAAQQSAPRPGDWRQGRLPAPARTPGDWAASLPPTEQKKIADTFSTGRLPARYEELLRAYNESLARQTARP